MNFKMFDFWHKSSYFLLKLVNRNSCVRDAAKPEITSVLMFSQLFIVFIAVCFARHAKYLWKRTQQITTSCSAHK